MPFGGLRGQEPGVLALASHQVNFKEEVPMRSGVKGLVFLALVAAGVGIAHSRASAEEALVLYACFPDGSYDCRPNCPFPFTCC